MHSSFLIIECHIKLTIDPKNFEGARMQKIDCNKRAEAPSVLAVNSSDLPPNPCTSPRVS